MVEQYVFRFSCKDFELEFRGDVKWVERQLNRYDHKINSKLKSIIDDQNHQAPPAKPEPRTRASAEPRPERRPEPRPETRPETPKPDAQNPQAQAEEAKSKRRSRSRRSRRKKPRPLAEQGAANPQSGDAQTRVNEIERIKPLPSPAAAAASDAAPEKKPQADNQAASAKPKPAEAPKSQAPRPEPYVHPPIDQGPAQAPDFPARRKAPKIKQEDLGPLIGKFTPRTQHDRIMLFGYYMEKDAKGSDFTVAEIKRCYKAVDEEPISNIPQVLIHATRSGFIMKKDTGRLLRYKLSAKGRRYVEHGLKLD